METLPARHLNWSIAGLKARLTEIDHEIGRLRREQFVLNKRFTTMLQQNARREVSSAGVQRAILSEDMFGLSGFENSPMRGKR